MLGLRVMPRGGYVALLAGILCGLVVSLAIISSGVLLSVLGNSGQPVAKRAIPQLSSPIAGPNVQPQIQVDIASLGDAASDALSKYQYKKATDLLTQIIKI